MKMPVKILHTSDLHLGKKLFGFSLEEDQRHFLNEIIRIAEEEKVDAIVIAGDIYDVPQPPEDAVRMFGDFLHRASKICKIYGIAGNHDSAERVGYARELLENSGVFLTGRYKGKAEKFELAEGVNIFLLPYLRTASARNFYDDSEIRNPDQAVKVTLDHSDIDPEEVNIIVAHQFIGNGEVTLEQTDSETARLSVGNDEIIHSDLFRDFDYGAFGHIHKPQLAGRREL
ncbi:MAG: exonuclease SbcCD subunit D, partial [archaeon]|nr:exonuclease SbcCD subunit D [archaeon]